MAETTLARYFKRFRRPKPRLSWISSPVGQRLEVDPMRWQRPGSGSAGDARVAEAAGLRPSDSMADELGLGAPVYRKPGELPR